MSQFSICRSIDIFFYKKCDFTYQWEKTNWKLSCFLHQHIVQHHSTSFQGTMFQNILSPFGIEHEIVTRASSSFQPNLSNRNHDGEWFLIYSVVWLLKCRHGITTNERATGWILEILFKRFRTVFTMNSTSSAMH
jgi:hypothetical protein